jgi:hypothetical protein
VDHQGAAAGLLNAALGLGYVLTPLVVLVLYEGVAPVAPYVLNCALLLAMLGVLHVARRRISDLG